MTVTTSEMLKAPATLDNNPFYGIKLDDEQRVFRDAIWNPNIDIVFVNAKNLVWARRQWRLG